MLSLIASQVAFSGARFADIGGYYATDEAKAEAALRPSGTFNSILAGL
jgi:isocitrate dehydrogenase